MKELNIEEKAKRYDEALEKMKEIITTDNNPTIPKEIGEHLFPELKESEDEKIRKELIDYINRLTVTPNNIDRYNTWVAWLENIPYTIDHEKREGFHLGYKAALEKQDEKSLTVDIDSMIEAYEHRLINQGNGVRNSPIVNMCVAAFKHGVENTLDELHLKQGETSPILSNSSNIGKDEQKPTIEMKSAEESLGIDSETYNEIVNDCIFGENKPKFKVGDWVVNTVGDTNQVVKVLYDGYTLDDNTFISNSWATEHYRLWTIQDAKGGDILFAKGSYFKEYAFIYYGMTEDNVMSTYCGFDMVHNNFDTKLSRFGRMEDFDVVYPTTKEQRDLLFKKMKEAGYEWDADKKELNKIEQKPAEWKQENVEELSEFENAMMHIGYSFFGKRGGLDPNDTSSVKVQAQYLLELAQKPAEWSEGDDDDAWMNDIISKAENNLQLNKAEIDWLKSLKQRIGG